MSYVAGCDQDAEDAPRESLDGFGWALLAMSCGAALFSLVDIIVGKNDLASNEIFFAVILCALCRIWARVSGLAVEVSR